MEKEMDYKGKITFDGFVQMNRWHDEKIKYHEKISLLHFTGLLIFIRTIFFTFMGIIVLKNMSINFRRIFFVMLMLVILSPCFSEEGDVKNDKLELLPLLGINIFGSVFEKDMLGIGLKMNIMKDPSSGNSASILDLGFGFGLGINIEYLAYNHEFQLRPFLTLDYYMFLEIEVSSIINIKHELNNQYGLAPGISLRMIPLHFFASPILAGLTYRYNMFFGNYSNNYQEITFSILIIIVSGD
jgi:hypothetical protein